MVLVVKNLPANVGDVRDRDSVQSLGWEDPLEKAMLPTPVFLPGESQGQRNLVGFSPGDHKESETTEQISLSLQGAYRIPQIRTNCYTQMRSTC